MAKERDEARDVQQPAAQVAPPPTVKYDVLVSFTDAEDKAAPPGANIYWAGKTKYPRDGYKPTEARIAYLQGHTNAFKAPVISGAPRK